MFWRTNECSIPNCMLFEAQESQKRETISSHVELLRASTNCQMQTNVLNNLKLIYCTGKTVGLKKQVHIGLAVDNKYDKFVVLQWLRKVSVQSLCVQMYRGTKQRDSRPAVWDFWYGWNWDVVYSFGHSFAREVLSEGNREENTGIPLQKGRLC